MKILVVTQYFWPENFKINDLCLGLLEKGHDVTVYTGLPNYPEGKLYEGYSFFHGPYFEKFETPHGTIPIIRSPLVTRGKQKSLRLIANYVSYFFLASILAPFLVRGKFDKIFVYEPSPITVAIPGIVLKFLKRAPMYFWVTDLWPESLVATNTVKNPIILNLVSLMVRVLYFFSDAILVTSQGFIQRVQNLGAPRKKIFYFPQWAEDLYREQPSSTFTDPLIPEVEDGFKIMFAGNIGSAQDFEMIMESALFLKNESHIHFLIVGDGMKKLWAEDFCRTHNLEKTVHFLGRKPIDQMPNYFSKADVLLMTLKDSEIFSITIPAKLQSYMAFGKPILSTVNGEAAQIIKDSRAGLVSPAGDGKKLSQTILQFSQMSKDERESMAVNGKNYYLKHFDRNQCLNRLIEIFNL